MSEELKLALQALGAISEKDTRLGNRREILRFFQRIQRVVAFTKLLTCEVDARITSICLAISFYPDDRYPFVQYFFFRLIDDEKTTSYKIKRQFFNELSEFVQHIKDYYNEREKPDPTKAYILP